MDRGRFEARPHISEVAACFDKVCLKDRFSLCYLITIWNWVSTFLLREIAQGGRCGRFKVRYHTMASFHNNPSLACLITFWIWIVILG